jgi:hypothetical protein
MESPSNDVCCICLDEMNEHQYHKELSCGHKLHFQCFKKLVFRKNMFVKCPVCRENNTNIDKPTSDPFTNIRLLSSSKVGNVRCLCKTKKGTICKHKSKLLNYGYCYQHHKDILKEEMYPLMVEYMYLILLQRNSWKTKLYLFDLGKQLIVKYCNSSSKIQDILSYFYKFMTLNNIYHIREYKEMYDYYGLKKPDQSWIDYCVEKHMII